MGCSQTRATEGNSQPTSADGASAEKVPSDLPLIPENGRELRVGTTKEIVPETSLADDAASTTVKSDATPLTDDKASKLPGKSSSESDATTNATVQQMPPHMLENPKVLLALSCVDLVGSVLFTYGCAMFIPSNMVDPSNQVLGLNLFILGLAIYFVLMGIFFRETLKTVGIKSMEFAELCCSMFALVLFTLGLVLFYPAHTLPRWIEAVRKPWIAFCNAISPEYMTHLPGSNTEDPGPQGSALTGAVFFLLGSLFFCVAPMLHMINMSNADLKGQIRDVANQIIKCVAGVLFTAGTMFFIPGVGCNYDAMALGGYLFVGASVCFAMTAVSDIIAASLAVADARQTSYSALSL